MPPNSIGSQRALWSASCSWFVARPKSPLRTRFMLDFLRQVSEHSRGRETARLRDGAPAARWAPLERHRRGVRDARRVPEDAPSWSRGRTRAGRAASGARSMRNGSRKATRSTSIIDDDRRPVGGVGRCARDRSWRREVGGMVESSRVFFRASATFVVGAPAPPAMRDARR